MHPTLPTLLRISMVFSVGLEYFFNAEPRPVLGDCAQDGAPAFSRFAGCREVAYYFESLDFPVSGARSIRTSPNSKRSLAGSTSTPASNFLYVLSGKLELRAGEDRHELAEGDAIYFDSTVPHGYRRIGARRTTALVAALGPGAPAPPSAS